MIPAIDAHQHFWTYEPARHEWINEDMAVIRRDFYPEHLGPLLAANGVEGCVSVQADQTEEETERLLNWAADNSFIKGVVGWVDLNHPDVEDRLAYYKQFILLKGFRHILQAEPAGFMQQPSFINGIKALGDYGFTYDLLVFPHQLTSALKLVEQFPEQPFVVDHLAKPYIKAGSMEEWKKDLAALARHTNVYCKLSGMVTEADWTAWSKNDLYPYMDVVVNTFGMDRLMFGSDWPVCLVAASYEDWIATVRDYFSGFTQQEQQQLFRDNAISFYQL